ncbi:protein ENHANCED DISEASE RESISTANCE 2 [Canna indica]|uniref:Protein ENHANCED DISEASE RESISTANCE 2 n=1 Tax=Canna indica TaxID=4628 RepID=A0AAQ3L949_9LILI|nr:protein ENHANCED DISEASE RESISTANCE 2 [Canna indica]
MAASKAVAVAAGETLSDAEGHGSAGSPLSESSREQEVEYFGWVYHLGVNSVGHEYCHLRYLLIKGTHVTMYKRDPCEHPGIKPIRKGLVSHTLIVEELGRRKFNNMDLYVLRFYNRLNQTKKGEIACASAGESHKWMEAFEQAKQQAEYNILRGSSRHRLSLDEELNLEGHRPRVRRYAKGLKKLIKIGKGPEMLIRKSTGLGGDLRRETYFEADVGDAIEMHEWRCVRTINGIRIFEDVTNSKGAKGSLLKSVGVVEANADTIFEVVLSLDKHKRYEWDMLTGDLELLDSVDGHCDVVYGTYDPTHLTWWHSKKDFVFSRQWFREQDGSYMILQFPAVNKKRPPRSGYHRLEIYPSTWEIRRLKTSDSSTAKCLVTHMLEVHEDYLCGKWRRNKFTDFDKSIPYALLCQVAGLKEYFGANPAFTLDSPVSIVDLKLSDASSADTEFKDSEVTDEFFDASAGSDSLEDEDSDDEIDLPKAGNLKLKNVSWAILALRRSKGLLERSEFDADCPSITIDPSQFHGSMYRSHGETDTNCWSSPNGEGFMIRGKNYLKDCSKIVGGDPLLELIAVDWFKADNNIEKVALHPKSLVQSKAGKSLPFILIINLQIPSKPNYGLVLYYASEKPVSKDSLLGKFVDGTDMFRDSRFKLIPSIVEGYWMVKRAVGTKACLLGKAVTCKYLRQDNFLEIDVDIGSSSVARSIIGLVIGYITSIVVDLAILIEAKEEEELPEYILGTVRLNRVRLESAIPYGEES